MKFQARGVPLCIHQVLTSEGDWRTLAQLGRLLPDQDDIYLGRELRKMHAAGKVERRLVASGVGGGHKKAEWKAVPE